MKVINYGSKFEIYSNDLKTHDALPPATYRVAFNPMAGFSLDLMVDFENMEEKIYGSHEEKIAKVLRTYDSSERSLGVILSGEKGMGKSLFVQLLSEAAIAKGLPVIIVSKPFKGVAEFLETIDQECLVMFDEFEKVFSLKNEGNETQNDLLGLFDGTSQRKRLYAVTVNKLHMVSEYMISRPGRFHYHLRFDYPSSTEIRTYMEDKLEEQYYGEIQHVISFATRVKLNYDSLRAIVSELNAGYTFAQSIGDLNILTTDNQQYNVEVNFSNGRKALLRSETLNLFDDSIHIGGHTDSHDYFSVRFSGFNVHDENEKMIVKGQDVELELTADESDGYPEGTVVSHIVITKKIEAGVNYRLTA